MKRLVTLAALLCSSIAAFSHENPSRSPNDVSLMFTTVATSCYGTSNGSATAIASGAAPYTYLWSTGATTATINNKPAGVYNVTVTGSDGSTASGSAVISQPAKIIAYINCINTCPDQCNGSATATVFSGGVAPFTYVWSNGGTTQTITGLCPAVYWVTITDATGCQKVSGAAVSIRPVINITGTVTNGTCSGACTGTVALSVSGGGTATYTYAWSNGSTVKNQSGLCPGNYCVTVTSVYGCTASECFTVSSTPGVTVSIDAENPDCPGGTGSACAVVSGGTGPFTYDWSSGATSNCISGLNGGVISVTVTDANACEGSATDIIVIPQSITVTAELTHPTVCINACDGEVDLTVVGGTAPYIYEWNTGITTQDLVEVCPGDYTVTVTDANGCTATVAPSLITLECVPDCDLVVTVEEEDVTCPGLCDGSIDVEVSGGTAPYVFAWSGGTTTEDREDLCEGFYSLTITDANGCTYIITPVTITEPNEMSLTANVVDAGDCGVDCEGSVNLSVSGGTSPYDYDWSNSVTVQDLNDLCAGTYCVMVTDNNGCTVEDCYTITCEVNCTGFRTQTQGGWGNTPNGNNPGMYLQQNFDDAFPSGLVIGDASCGYTITLTSSNAVMDFLPSGSTGAVLTQNYTDPGGSLDNVFAGQVTALAISVGLDLAIPTFSSNTIHLEDLYYNVPGDFYGWTVEAILDTAMRVLSGCPSSYTPQDLNDVVASINENYTDGTTDNGNLVCTPPPGIAGQNTGGSLRAAAVDNARVMVSPNPFVTNANIEFTLASDDANVTLDVYNVTGQKMAELFRGAVNANQKYNISFDGATLAEGIYIYRLVTSNETFTGQLTRVKP